MKDRNQKIKIVFLTGQINVGGSEKQLLYLLKHLDKNKFSPIIVTIGPVIDKHWLDAIKIYGTPILYIKEKSRLKKAWAVRKIIHQQKCQIIQSIYFYMTPYAWIAKLFKNIKLVGWVRFLPDKRGLKVHKLKLLKYVSLYGPDATICNSQFSEYLLKKKLNVWKPVFYIPNGFSVMAKSKEKRYKHELREKLGLLPNIPVVGYVGRLDLNKNVSLLIKAVKSLVSEYPIIKLIIIGDGPMLEELKIKVEKLDLRDNIIFLGQLPNAENWMPAFDIFCLPSKSEGMPNVLMEAASVGIPVVASDVGGVSEIVQNGVTGYLFPSEDEFALAKFINILLKDQLLCIKMGTLARENITTNFSVLKMVRAHESLYLSFYPKGYLFEEN